MTGNPTADPVDYYYDNAQYASIVNEKQGAFSASYLLPSRHMVRYVSDGEGSISKQVAVHGSKDVEAVLDQNGNIQKIYHYSPNGIIQPINLAGQIEKLVNLKAASFGIVENPFQYSGEYRDSESGLDYLSARYYHPTMHRFIQRDSYQLLNRYAYVKGNPIMNVDPSGHKRDRLSTVAIIGMVATGLILVGIGYAGFRWHLNQRRENFASARKSFKQSLDIKDDRSLHFLLRNVDSGPESLNKHGSLRVYDSHSDGSLSVREVSITPRILGKYVRMRELQRKEFRKGLPSEFQGMLQDAIGYKESSHVSQDILDADLDRKAPLDLGDKHLDLYHAKLHEMYGYLSNTPLSKKQRRIIADATHVGNYEFFLRDLKAVTLGENGELDCTDAFYKAYLKGMQHLL